MYYEKSREEFYEERLHEMAKQMAELLDAGLAIEVSKSRSGLKLFTIKRRHEIIRRSPEDDKGAF